MTLLFCLDQGIKAPEDPIKVTHKMEILVSANALACFKFASLTPNQSGCEQQNSEKIMLVQSVLRCLEFKVHKRKFITLQIFTSPLFFFLLTSMLSLWQNNFIFEKSIYFPVIPDDSHNLLRSWQ